MRQFVSRCTIVSATAGLERVGRDQQPYLQLFPLLLSCLLISEGRLDSGPKVGGHGKKWFGYGRELIGMCLLMYVCPSSPLLLSGLLRSEGRLGSEPK